VLVEAEAILDGEPPEEHATIIVDQVERLRALTKSMLQLSASRPKKAARVGVDTTATEVDVIVGESARMLAGLARKSHVELRVSTEARGCVAVAPAELTQLVVNLVVNGIQAIESSPAANARVVSITTEAFQDNGARHIRIEVRDTGPGIPNDDREQ
jgi:signal transduction histidine kinase